MAGKNNDKTQALDLLGDILADTQKEAEDERRKREEVERKKVDAAKRQVEAEDQQRREEAEARLRAEEERQQAALERRRMAQAAMSEDVEEEDDKNVPAQAGKKVVEEKRSSIPMLLAAIVLVGLGVGGFFIYTEMTKEYVATASFARSAPAVVDISNVDSSQEVAFLAKPVIEQPEAEAAAQEEGRNSGQRRNRRPAEPEQPRGLQLRQGLSGR